ncbi:MAG: hypothetical protein CVT90_01380, partial [Candidatus Altiarchaeales archaeon HGW-Altiarchaeales-3]
MIKLKIKNSLTHLISGILFIAVLSGYGYVSVFAQETDAEFSGTISYIELEINENGVVNVTQKMEVYANESIYRADTIIPKAKGVEVYDLQNNIKLEHGSLIIDDEELIIFYFQEPLNAGEKRNITLKYSTEFFTNKQGETWELSFLLIVSNKSIIKAIFPENVVISLTSSEIVPLVYIENERQVLELESDGSEIDFLCEYKFVERQEASGETRLIGTKNETDKNEEELQEIPGANNGVDYADYLLKLLIGIIGVIILA